MMHDDKAFILNPDAWSGWPMLPLRRQIKGKNPEHLTLLDESRTNGYRGYLTTIFRFDPDAAFLDYATVDLLLADGWEVD